MRVEWRRDELTGPDGDGEPALVDAIRAEIADRGPITFARFMERALYEPDLGYYARSTDRTSAQGDFVTAPELHPVFGLTLARVVDEMWRRMGRPSPFTIREYGAGSGALFLALLDGLVRISSPLAAEVRYEPIDQPLQRRLIRERLDAANARAFVHEPDGKPFTGVVLANEFLDALPVHRVVQREGALRETLVDWADDRFVEVEGEPSTGRLVDWFRDAGVTLADGQRAEVNLAVLDWVASVGAELERGHVLVIDYGADAAQLYDPARRPDGTVRAFAGQRVSSDVLGGVGRRDITAHVDFDALERAARAAGLEILGRRRMAEFLIAAGLDEAYAAARAEADSDWESALTLRAAIRRLIDPGALGGYLASVMGRGVNTSDPLSALRDAP
jgi:SAM-dependent MidA family methyltransferase